MSLLSLIFKLIDAVFHWKFSMVMLSILSDQRVHRALYIVDKVWNVWLLLSCYFCMSSHCNLNWFKLAQCRDHSIQLNKTGDEMCLGCIYPSFIFLFLFPMCLGKGWPRHLQIRLCHSKMGGNIQPPQKCLVHSPASLISLVCVCMLNTDSSLNTVIQ